MGATFAQKLLALKGGKASVEPGEIVTVRPDHLLTHDNTAAIISKIGEDLGTYGMADPETSVIVLDHVVPAASEKTATNHKKIREFVAGHGIKHFYDTGEGICHEVLIAKGHAFPGSLIVGSDSHTCTYGAVGAFATGIDRTEAASIMLTGKTWLKVPQSLKVNLKGRLAGPVSAKDLVLTIIGDIGADGILGTGPVMSCGVGLSSKLKKDGRVTVCFFGDGQTNSGRFHEALNLSSCWKLPVVYLCENNTYGESTYIYDVTNLTKLTDRALSYDIPSVEIDGNEVLAVYEAVTAAAARARKGEGPTFIEAKTCRWRGHYEGDTQTYRTEKEIADCKKKDPIARFRKELVSRGVMTEAEAAKIHKEAVEEINQAVKFAEESPYPEAAEIYTDIY